MNKSTIRIISLHDLRRVRGGLTSATDPTSVLDAALDANAIDKARTHDKVFSQMDGYIRE